MAYLDLNQHQPTFTRNQFDVVIIGSGIAGILLAVKLNERGKKVLLIESGHFENDPQRQTLNEVEQSGKILEHAVEGRKRAIGGTSLAWGGQSLPFSRLDFEHLAWMPESGWPVRYDDLKAYYHAANRFMGIDECDYEDEIFKLLGLKKLPFNDEFVSHHFSKWAPQPNLQKKYGTVLANSPGITVLYNAVLTRFDLDDHDRVTQIAVHNFNRQENLIPVRQLIISTGGIEANRILLSNNHQKKGGIGNHSGWLGKCFMDHPCIEIGTLEGQNSYRMQAIFNTHVHRRRKYSVRISFSDKARQKYQLVNGSASVMFDYPGNRFDPYAEVRQLLQHKKLVSLRSSFKHFDSYARSLRALLLDGFIYKHKAVARIVLMIEQEPQPQSMISLSTEKDPFGVPKALIHWNISRQSWDAVNKMAEMLKHELHRLSLGEVLLHAHVFPGNENWAAALSDVGHHLGGTRMSASRENGVVNRDLQVWGHENVYVCSTSVFPTGSHSNPTLTMMALGSRLVDKLTC